MIGASALLFVSATIAAPWSDRLVEEAAADSTATVSAAWIADVVAGRDVLPALADVQDAAEAALLAASPRDVVSWAHRARMRGLVPRLDVALGTDSDLDVRDSYSTGRSRTTTEGRAFGFELGARWELGDLVFSDGELRASREALARAASVRLAREEVTRLYFERVELLLEARGDHPEADRLRAARIEGLLRALTGGRFRVREEVE